MRGVPRRLSCDCDDVAEHSLARQVRSGARSDDRDFSDRAGLAHQRVGGAVDAGQHVVGRHGLGLHAGGHGSGPARPRERKRRDVPAPPSDAA